MKAQHVSSGIPLIIKSSKLYLQPLVYIPMWGPAVAKAGQRPVTTWVYKPEAANTRPTTASSTATTTFLR